MIKPATLDEIFTILNEMTSAKHGERAFLPSKKFQLAEKALITSYLVSLLLLVATMFYAKQFNSTPQANQVVFWLYVCNTGLSISYLLTVTLGITHMLWRQYQKPYSIIMQRMNLGLHGDLAFLSRLNSFDTNTLKYALVQYRQSWEISENRVSLLVGNLRKLGLFPALAAASISASALMKEDSNFLLWLPIILAAIFSIIGFIALGQRERPQQVIELLEYVIYDLKEANKGEADGKRTISAPVMD